MTTGSLLRFLATTALCLAAMGLSSCSGLQALSAKKSLPECYLTYSDGYPWTSEPPAVLRLNADECRELLAIEAETEEDTPMWDIQIASGNPEFCIFPQGKDERFLSSLSTVKNWTDTYIPEAAAKRFDALVKTVESRPESRLSQAETQRWHKQHFPHFVYRRYYKD